MTLTKGEDLIVYRRSVTLRDRDSPTTIFDYNEGAILKMYCRLWNVICSFMIVLYANVNGHNRFRAIRILPVPFVP